MVKKLIHHYLDKKNTNSFLWKFVLNSHFNFIRLIKREPNFLKINKNLYDKYVGRRCFILGNGPSLNELDFKILRDEYVFTVNMLMEHERFLELNSNFHVMVDQEIFNPSDVSGLDKDYYMHKIEKLYQCKDLILFVPISNAVEIEKKGVNKSINVRYLESYNHYKEIDRIEIDKIMPAFNKVIQYAIALAVYMGFEEINLLGCEETGILPYINLIMSGETNDDHCYKDTDDEKKAWKSFLKQKGISFLFEDQAMVFKRYRLISDFCKRKGVRLQNLTPNSLIDSIQKVSFESVLERKRK